jgi:peptidyl-prolyl cis-trans isomerase D
VADLQTRLPLARFAGSISETAIAPRSVAVRLAAIEAQKREVSEVRISEQQFLPQVKIDEAQAKAHYDAHQADYRTPERVRAEYVVLSAEALARQDPPTEAEIRAAYDARASQFRVEEQRRASHILVKTKEEADKIFQELKKNPAGLAELAKKHSQDPGSAEKGGDLGWFGRGMMVKPFEEAVFKLGQNEMQVVETEFGFHVVRVTGIQAAKARPYEELRKELAEELARQKGQRKFAEAAENFSNLVYEQSESLKPAAERFKLQVQQTGWIAKSARQELGALDNPKLLAALFSSDSIKNRRNTDAIEVAPSTLVAARVLEHQPAAQRGFDEMKGEIAEQLRRREASALALKDGTAKLEKLRQGADPGVKWSLPRLVSRRDAQGLPANVLRQVIAGHEQAAGLRRHPDPRRRLRAASHLAGARGAGEGGRSADRRARRPALWGGAVRGLHRQPAQPRRHRNQRRYSGEEVAGIPATTWLKPASTYRISPVIAAARSDSRKAAALPTSSVVTLRRSGACSSTNFRILPKPAMPAAASVLIGPAEIAFTLMPCGPRLAAR